MNRPGRRLMAPVTGRLSGARVIALAATTAIHVMALAGILLAPAPPSRGVADETRPLVVIALRPPPASPQVTPVSPPKVAKTSLARRTQPPDPIRALPLRASPGQWSPPTVQQLKSHLEVATPAIQSVSAAKGAVDLLADYKLQLWRHIDAHRPRGVQGRGTALIGFRVASDGTLLSSQIARSSGNMLLDRIALRAVRQAEPLPWPPESLLPDQLTFVIPLNFR